MSWHWSRLSTLAVLALLYAAPLSSGDKGLWLSVASMPVPLFGTIPGGVAPEHSILLSNRGDLSLVRACAERSEPALGPGLVAVDDATVDAAWTSASQPPAWSTRDPTRLAPAAPRGPPA
jgi:hypothetical protein